MIQSKNKLNYNKLHVDIKSLINSVKEELFYGKISISKLMNTLNRDEKLVELINNYNESTKDFDTIQKLMYELVVNLFDNPKEQKEIMLIKNFISEELDLKKNDADYLLNELKRLSIQINYLKLNINQDLITQLLEDFQDLNYALETIINYYKIHINSKQYDKITDDEFCKNLIDTYFTLNSVNTELNDTFSTDIIKVMIKEASKYPLLPNEKINELAISYQRGNKKAYDELILHNMRLVISIAKRYIGRGLSFEDLIQEGNLGLMKAIDYYDPLKGFQFSTYATWWIKQVITRALADKSRNIRIPVHTYEKINKLTKAIEKLTDNLGRTPSIAEIAEKLEISAEKVVELYRLFGDTVSIHSKVDDEDDRELLNFIYEYDETAIEDSVIAKMVSEAVINYIDQLKLTKRESTILMHRFNLNNHQFMTLEELGEVFDVTRERIRQIEAKAIKKIFESRNVRKLCDLTDDPERAYQIVLAYRKAKSINILNPIESKSGKNKSIINIIDDYIEEQPKRKSKNKLQPVENNPSQNNSRKEEQSMASTWRPISLCIVFEKTVEQLNKITFNLNLEEKELLNKYYDEFYSPKVIEDEDPKVSRDNRKLIIKSIRNIMKPDKQLPKPKTNIYSASLTYILAKTEYELNILYSKLDRQIQNLVKVLYDESYMPLTPENMEQSTIIFNRNMIISSFKKLIKEKNKKMIPSKQGKKASSIPELLKTDLDTAKKIISKLSAKCQSIIKKYYNEDDLTRNKVLFNAEDTGTKTYAIKRCRELLEKPDIYAKYNLTTITEASVEEIDAAMLKLTKEEQELIRKYFDKNYERNNTNVDRINNEHRQLNKLYTKLKKIIHNIEGPKKKRGTQSKALNELLSTDLDTAKKLIKTFPEKVRNLISKYYNEDLIRNNTPFIKAEERTVRYYIRISRENSKKSETLRIRYNNLTDRINTTVTHLRDIFSTLEENEQSLILKYYDQDFKRNDIPFSDGENIIVTRIVTKIKKILSKDQNSAFMKKETIENNLANSLDCNPNITLPINVETSKILNGLNNMEIVIVSLKLGVGYNTETVAKLLGIDEQIVRDVTRRYLLAYQEHYNKMFEEKVELIVNDKLSLERKKEGNY